MTERTIEQYRKLLETKRDELRRSMASRDEIAIERSADELDAIQLASERDAVIRNLDSKAALLREVAAAIHRTEDDNFGICLRCENEISPKRLAAVPWTAYCIGCQELVDTEAQSPAEMGDELQLA